MTTVERIQAACSRVIAKGYTVQPGKYGIRWNDKQKRWAPMRHAQKCMCPLGALVVVEQPSPGAHATAPFAARVLLGVDIGWIADFQVTLDGVLSGLDGAGADAARQMLTWLEQQSLGAPEESGAVQVSAETAAEGSLSRPSVHLPERAPS